MSPWNRTANPPAPSVVDEVARQASEAADLARIQGQERLSDPRTNPAVRQHADQLRNNQQLHALEAEHARKLRTIRVADSRATDAEQALEAIRASREMSSAARSVLALHRGRTQFMRIALGASLTLSAGAAIGFAQLAEKLDAPAEVGYIAEVGCTGLTTLVILYRSHLTRHGGKLDDWKNFVLWVLMAAPLIASMTANAFGSGPVGIACSVGAAAFSLFSYVIADASAEAIHEQAATVSREDEDELREVAASGAIFSQEPVVVPEVEKPPLPVLSEDELITLGFESARTQAWLASRGIELSSSDVTRALAPATRTRPVEEIANHLLAGSANRELSAGPSRTPDPEPPSPRTPNREQANPELPNREPFVNHEPAVHEPTMNREPEFANRAGDEVREPGGTTEPEEQQPEDAPPPPNREPRTANPLGDRAARKASEVEKVLDLIRAQGRKAVQLPAVIEALGVGKTTAHHRLKAARELWDANPGLANREPGSRTGS